MSKPKKAPAEVAALVFCLACVVTGLALVITPLTSEYTNPDIRITAYLMAWVVLWAAVTPVVGWRKADRRKA